MGANVDGKARRFLPYLGPEGVGGYRRKCDEIAEKATKASCSRARARAGRSTALQPNRSVNPRPGAVQCRAAPRVSVGGFTHGSRMDPKGCARTSATPERKSSQFSAA